MTLVMSGTGGRDALLAEVAAIRPGPGGVHLTALCRRLRTVLRADRVWLRLTDGSEYVWPDAPNPVRGRRLRWLRLIAGSEVVGAIGLEQGLLPLSRRRERLLSDAVDLLGPVLHGVQTQNELDRSLESARGHAERVASLRRRAFGERDAERQEIERDIHDGAQHHLVSLGITLGLLEVHAQNPDPAPLTNSLGRLREGLDLTERSLLAITTGGSELLAEEGVLPALLAEFRDAGTLVTLRVEDWDSSQRYETVVELAIYFICLEAVNNARKHAPGAEVVLWLSDHAGGLRFSVTDAGPGMSSSIGRGMSGLINMRRRMVAAGGRIQVRTGPGAGTAVHGFIPF
ncbi:sensor histidine kinase [Kineosporia babensis]|uniref:Histidine kinase n=1 Tax=Kineosporia babensis TaxID=499548 RepID=A0A9X1NAU9_9ACTN|nr:ATP-binding protein [Kineosporia babensis]MCD5310320.1 histidine kinase [Kineosporia babensis]